MKKDTTGLTTLWSVVVLLALSACSQKTPDPNDPDFLLINGNFITMDDDDSIVKAVSVRGEKTRSIPGPNHGVWPVLPPPKR